MIIENKRQMLTTRQKSLSLSGGGIVSDLSMPSYSPNAIAPNAQAFPWEDEVNDINTPDIDLAFFDNNPLKMFKTQTSVTMASFIPEEDFLQNCLVVCDESTEQSYESMDLSQLISQTNVDIKQLLKESESMVAPNEVLDSHYMPASTAPVLHYLQPKPIESIASALSLESMTTNASLIDSSHSSQESMAHFSSPSTHTSQCSSQSYSPAFSTINRSYLSPTPSPALSYTSTTSHSTLVSMDALTSDSSVTIEVKPEVDLLFHPTVINDHLYTLPSTSSSSKRKSSTDKKHLSVRKKNNMASKKSRVTKRDKQKIMDDQIQHYVEDNAKCKQMIATMEREIQWCKDYLFKKVVAS